MINCIRRAITAALLALIVTLCTMSASTASYVPPWPASSVIYSIYPSIFSPQGNFAGVTAQMDRLKRLGITVIWIMPVTPIGQAVNGHPSVNSPYCVHDYFALNPAYGSPASFRSLMKSAHAHGIKVILDEVLNHTAWDNALITQHPEFYVHNDTNVNNPGSIKMAFNYADVAQLNYANRGLRTYMIGMLEYWIKTYHVDGFRFDTSDDPDGPGRMIPADFWQEMGTQVRALKPDVLLLGEGETPDLALKPFALDYGWHMYDAVKHASAGGSAADVLGAWRYQADDYPASMKHMSIQDDWDNPRDVNIFGGPAGAMALAAFYFTDTGVPMIYNGMEIGNAGEAVNPHAPIDWNAGNARFPEFYRQLIALRRHNPALQDGTMKWLTNTVANQVLTYTRTSGSTQFLVEVNLSGTAANGSVDAPGGSGWTPVRLPGVESGTMLMPPPQVSLQPKEFAIFKRSL